MFVKLICSTIDHHYLNFKIFNDPFFYQKYDLHLVRKIFQVFILFKINK